MSDRADLASPFFTVTRAIRVMRRMYPDIPATTIEAFLIVADKPGISSRDLQPILDVSQSAVSRHLSLLADRDWRGGEGLKLVDSRIDPADRRRRVHRLTRLGELTAAEMAKPC